MECRWNVELKHLLRDPGRPLFDFVCGFNFTHVHFTAAFQRFGHGFRYGR